VEQELSKKRLPWSRTYNVIDSDGHVLEPPTSGLSIWIRRTASAPLSSSSIPMGRSGCVWKGKCWVTPGLA